MKKLLFPLAGLALVAAIAMPTWADFPKPSLVPISWELTVTHGKPKRIVVTPPGDDGPSAYWYITYHVVNNTEKEKVPFYPTFDMMTEDGRVIRSDTGIAAAVFDAVKAHEHIKFLVNNDQVAGELKSGEDQARDGVAIWKEPDVHMGTFNIFASGFCGETAVVKVGDKDVTLRKTLELTYHYAVDDADPLHGNLEVKDSTYVMR